jgi:hypothetical protein
MAAVERQVVVKEEEPAAEHAAEPSAEPAEPGKEGLIAGLIHKGINALENATGVDIDGDGTVGGKVEGDLAAAGDAEMVATTQVEEKEEEPVL